MYTTHSGLGALGRYFLTVSAIAVIGPDGWGITLAIVILRVYVEWQGLQLMGGLSTRQHIKIILELVAFSDYVLCGCICWHFLRLGSAV